MKLIDLLVQELPKRGGWPDGVEEIKQCWDGQVWYDDKEAGIMSPAEDARRRGEAFDLRKGVYREQYEAALAASHKPAWNGEGLPPVGMVVEWLSDKHGWLGGTVAAHDAKYPLIAIIRHNDGYTGCHRHEIRTEADRKRDEVVDRIVEHYIGYHGDPKGGEAYIDRARALYTAIADGKIPGIKLDGDA